MIPSSDALDSAAAELAEYARGQGRSKLVAACWRAGIENVKVIALLANVGRQTVYHDLEREGIDWAKRRQPRTLWRESPVTRQLVESLLKSPQDGGL